MSKRSIKDFLRAVVEVEERFGMTLGHEDHQGAFIVQDFYASNVKWLRAALNATTTAPRPKEAA